jgi:hypothetical protein
MVGVHCVWLDDAEIALMGARGAALAYCPGSNMFLGDGITRLPEMLRAGVRVGLGTDGGCTNNRLSVFEEMRTCSLLQRVRLLDGTALPATTAFDLGTRSAAAMLSLEAGPSSPVSSRTSWRWTSPISRCSRAAICSGAWCTRCRPRPSATSGFTGAVWWRTGD